MSCSRWGRSVNDFSNEDALREALLVSDATKDCVCISSVGSEQSLAVEDQVDVSLLDWYIGDVNKNISVDQTIDNEVERLMVLKSYMIVGELEKEKRRVQFDRVSRLANKQFGTQMSFITIMDLGRALFFGKDQLPVDGVARKGTFCAHAMVARENFFEVRDCKRDSRFNENPYVQAGAVQFYAAHALTSPEGYRLGMFAIVGDKPRPNGLSAEEIETLKEYADFTVEGLVAHRTLMKTERQLNKARHRLAGISHDITTPLTGVQLSISLLESDSLFQQSAPQHQKECLTTAASCAQVMADICDSLRDHNDNDDDSSDLPLSSVTTNGPIRDVINIQAMVSRLHAVMDNIPTQAPLTICVAPRVPENIVGDELKIFRACLTLLTYCCDRSTVGTVRMTVRVRESVKDGRCLLVEVEDCGPELDRQEQAQLFDSPDNLEEAINEGVSAMERRNMETKEQAKDPNKPNPWSTLGIFSVATQVQGLGGDFGVFPLSPHDADNTAPSTRFWFSIPMTVPDDATVKKDLLSKSQMAASREVSQIQPVSVGPRRALVVDDSAVVRKIIAKSLVRLGFETDQASDGQEGLEKMKKVVYDVVFLDFLMPVMDGLDCVRVFREWELRHRSNRLQRIVGISAHASRKDVQKGLLLGMNSYQSKPLTVEVLETITRQSPEPAGDLNVIEDTEPSRKRAKYDNPSREKTILVAGDQETFCHVKESATMHGWNTRRVRNSEEALQLLKSQNWGAVLVDSSFSDFDVCVREFRAWEQDNRINRQNNVCLLDANAPEPCLTRPQELPDGVDVVLRKPVQVTDVGSLIQRIDDDPCDSSRIILRHSSIS